MHEASELNLAPTYLNDCYIYISHQVLTVRVKYCLPLMMHVAVLDEIVTGSIQTPVVKPDLNKANPKLGVGVVNFSANCRYMYSKNGRCFFAYLHKCVWAGDD